MAVVDPSFYWLLFCFGIFVLWSRWSSEDVVGSGRAMENLWEART